MLAPGDHATAELPGLLGLPNNAWIAVRQWMDDHLRGIGAVDPDRAVALKSAGGGGWHFYSDWPTASPDRTRRYLSEPISEHPLFPRTGFLQADAAPSWGYPIEAGIPTAAESGDALITGALEGYFNVPPTVLIPLIRRSAAGVWSTHRLSASALLSGSAHVHLTIASSAATGSLFVYLYDVDEVDLGRLITHVPYTLAHAAPDAPRTVDVHLEPISWRVHGGHCLALVIDTMDRRYRSASVVGSTIRISSPAGDPSYTCPSRAVDP